MIGWYFSGWGMLVAWQRTNFQGRNQALARLLLTSARKQQIGWSKKKDG